jgi:hypothetical protein
MDQGTLLSPLAALASMWKRTRRLPARSIAHLLE